MKYRPVLEPKENFFDEITFDLITKTVLKMIPAKQKDRVFNQDRCEIDGSFIGFVDIYNALSRIIPKHYTIIDLGCGYNSQSFLFDDFEGYIAVDIHDLEIFKSSNCTYYNMDIARFIKEIAPNLDLNKCFAICSYVPEWGNLDKSKLSEVFPNLFTFYPS